MYWYSIKNSEIHIQLWVKPNAKKTQWLAVGERGLEVAVKAKPDEGKANKALIDFLARQLKQRKKDIQIIRGQTSRQKQLGLPFSEAVVEKLRLIDKQFQV